MANITAQEEDVFAHYQRAGQLPLWAPEVQMGYPMIGIAHQGFFYPPHLILRQFFPGIVVINVSLFLHTLLSFIGTYLLLRSEKYQKYSSVLGAVLFAGTGFFVGKFFLTNIILPLSWLPFQLYCLSQWYQKRSLSPFLGLTIAVALQIILGQPQVELMSVVVLAIYSLNETIFNFKKTYFSTILLIPAAILALSLSYFQIQPTLSVLPNSDRSEAMPKTELYEFSYPAQHTLSIIFPHIFGNEKEYFGAKNEAELSSWLGITLTLLIFYGIFSFVRKRNKTTFFILLLCVISLLLALGPKSTLYVFLVENNWLNSMAIPARWITLIFLAFSFFVAEGVQKINASSKKSFLAFSLLSILLCLILAFAAFKNLEPSIADRAVHKLLTKPFFTIIPLLALISYLTIFTFKFKTNNILLLLLVCVEVVVPNFLHTKSVPFRDVQKESVFERDLKTVNGNTQNTKPTLGLLPRFFAYDNFSAEPPPRINFEPYTPINPNISYRQSFTSKADSLLGFLIEFRWGNIKKTDNKIKFEIKDMQTGETRHQEVAPKNFIDGESTAINFLPFDSVLGHKFQIEFSSASRGPWILYNSFPRNRPIDALSGGAFSFCKNNSCEEPVIGSIPAGKSDLVISPIYPPNNEYLLSQERLSPNYGIAKGLSSTQWIGAMQLLNVKKYLRDIGDQNQETSDYNNLTVKNREMFNRTGTEFIVSTYEEGQDIGNFRNTSLLKESIKQQRFIRLFNNEESHKRAEFVKKAKFVSTPEKARTMLLSVKNNDDPTPITSDKDGEEKQYSIGTVDISSYKATEVILNTKNSGEGLLVLRDTFYPDWHAYVDGAETRIFPADWIFRGIVVPPGEHTITFRYTPTKTIDAIKISLATWSALIIFGLVSLHRKYWWRKA